MNRKRRPFAACSSCFTIAIRWCLVAFSKHRGASITTVSSQTIEWNGNPPDGPGTLKRATDQSTDCVSVTNRDRVTEGVNRTFEVLTCYGRARALGQRPCLRKSRQPHAFNQLGLDLTILSGPVATDEPASGQDLGDPLADVNLAAPVRVESAHDATVVSVEGVFLNGEAPAFESSRSASLPVDPNLRHGSFACDLTTAVADLPARESSTMSDGELGR